MNREGMSQHWALLVLVLVLVLGLNGRAIQDLVMHCRSWSCYSWSLR
jgi:hypothetical protein